MNRQVEIKIEQIARMVIKGMKLTQIAIEMGMSYAGLNQIVRRSEYLVIEEKVRKMVVGKMDQRLAKRAEMSDEVEDAVPEAMRVLLENVTKKRDLRAALEVLDRDPRRQFAKRTEPVVNSGQAGIVPPLTPDALANVVKEADITHAMQTAAQQPIKAEA